MSCCKFGCKTLEGSAYKVKSASFGRLCGAFSTTSAWENGQHGTPLKYAPNMGKRNTETAQTLMYLQELPSGGNTQERSCMRKKKR